MTTNESLDRFTAAGPAPVEPSAEIRELAAVVRQAFIALQLEGFDERQALAIVGQILAASK